MKSAPRPPADPTRSNPAKTPDQPIERTISALTPSQFDALFQLLKELTGVMEMEAQLLSKQDMKGIAELLPRKLRLLSTYQANVQVISNNPDLLKNAPEKTRNQLKTIAANLHATANQNANRLKGALLATRRIVSNVMGSIREETQNKLPSYANLRVAHMARNKYSPMCQAVAVRTTA